VKKKPATAPKKAEEGDTAAHPSGLSGIDLLIWKAEQREKNND
jgi:hypothetical protein